MDYNLVINENDFLSRFLIKIQRLRNLFHKVFLILIFLFQIGDQSHYY